MSDWIDLDDPIVQLELEKARAELAASENAWLSRMHAQYRAKVRRRNRRRK